MKPEKSIFISRPEMIDKINHFSSRHEPFLFAIDFSGENGFVLSPKEADVKGIQYEISKRKSTRNAGSNKSLKFEIFPINIETYKIAFEKVAFHLKRGDTYLLNLTFPTSIWCNHSLSEIFHISNAPYKLLIPEYFVVFSPEIFIQIKDFAIISCPMKGTIDAGVPNAEHKLLTDEKEFFEHNTIVDLIRNDLSMVSKNVLVARSRYIDRIHSNRGDLLQMSSEVCGTLPEDYLSRLGEILFALLPAGSVTGAPKEQTVKIIHDAEPHDRGFYTGIFGYFDGQSLDAAVSIRFIEQTGHGLIFRSGGGITALSNLKSEYDEMLKKVYVPVI